MPAVNALAVGDPADRGNSVGPVINEKAAEKIAGYIEVGRGEGRVVAGGDRRPGDGYFIEPTVIADVAPQARIAQERSSGRSWP